MLPLGHDGLCGWERLAPTDWESRCRQVEAELTEARTRNENLKFDLDLIGAQLGISTRSEIEGAVSRMLRQLDEARTAREAAETALRELAFDTVTAGANPQRDGSMSPPLWHVTCRLCDARWSNQTWKRQDAEALHPPHTSPFSEPCLLTPPVPQNDTEQQS